MNTRACQLNPRVPVKQWGWLHLKRLFPARGVVLTEFPQLVQCRLAPSGRVLASGRQHQGVPEHEGMPPGRLRCSHAALGLISVEKVVRTSGDTGWCPESTTEPCRHPPKNAADTAVVTAGTLNRSETSVSEQGSRNNTVARFYELPLFNFTVWAQ